MNYQTKELTTENSDKSEETLLKVADDARHAFLQHCRKRLQAMCLTTKAIKLNPLTHPFNGAVRRSGIKPCRFHDLRRTQAVRLRAAGVSIENIQALNNWKDIKTALRYTLPREEALRLDLEKLNTWSQNQSHSTL